MQGMPFQNPFYGQQIQPMMMGIQHHQNLGFEQIASQQPGPPIGMMPFIMIPQHDLDQFQHQQQFMQQQFQQQMAFNQHSFQQPNQSMIFPIKKKNLKPKITGKLKNEVLGQQIPEQIQFIPEIRIPIIEQFPQYKQNYQPLRNSNQKKKQNLNQKVPSVTLFDQQQQSQQIDQNKQEFNQILINSINNQQIKKEKQIQMMNPQQIHINPTDKKIKSDQKSRLKQLDTNLFPQQSIQSSRYQDNTPLRIIHKYPQPQIPQQKNQIFNYQEQASLKNGKQIENQYFHDKLEYKKAESYQTPQKQKYNENVQGSEQNFNIENQNFNCLVDMDNISKALTSEKNEANFNFKPLSIEFDNLEEQNFQNHSEFKVNPLFQNFLQNPQNHFENQNSNFLFKNSNDYQVNVDNCQLDNQKSLNKSKKSQKKNNKNSQIMNSFNYLSMTETGGQISISNNHQITANCLRKCSKWTLKISEFNKIGNGLTIKENSGIALRQMNYSFEKGLSKDQLNEKKRNLMMPKSSQYFENDIIDDMLIFENSLIFNSEKKDFHDTNCLYFKNLQNTNQENFNNLQTNGVDEQILKSHKCCQPALKMFNRYSQKSYLDQQIDLPFDIQMNTNSSLSCSSLSFKGDGSQTNEFDTFSQISSQLSEQSRQGSLFQGFQTKQNANGVVSNLEKYKELPLREQLVQILNVKQAENMFCIEFDLTGFPIQVPSNFEKTHTKEEIENIILEVENNRKFRVLNQSMIENIIQLKLSGYSHDSPIFSPSNFYLNFNIQGKKIIKSIQSRILDLKSKLSHQSKELNQNKLKMHDQLVNNPDKSIKFYLNQIEHNNKNGKGPWVTQTKKSLLVKLLNFNGKSIAFQIRIPQLYNLRNQMSNFNQLVLQEFEIEKILICIDLPLSRINKSQAQNINDLDDYLIARQILPQQSEVIKSPNIEQNSGEQQQQSSSELTSQGTPMNLLNEYMALQQVTNQSKITHLQQIHGFNSQNNFQTANQNIFNSQIQQQINQIKPFQSEQSENQPQPILEMQVKQNESNNSTNSHTGGSLNTEIDKNCEFNNLKFEADNDGAESATFQTDANSQEIDHFNQINEMIDLNYKVPIQLQKQFVINNQMKDQTHDQINSGISKSSKDDFQNQGQPTFEINNYFQQPQFFKSQIQQYNQQQEQMIQQAYYQQQYFQLQGQYQAYFPNYQYQNQQFSSQNQYSFNQFDKNDEIQDKQIQMLDQNAQFNQNFDFQQQEIIKHIPAPALQMEVQKGCYKIENFIKEDRSQMSNLDRFMESTIPVGFNIHSDSLVDLLLAYHQASISGTQIEFQDERQPGQAQLFYFTPTLSSLYFTQIKNFNDSSKAQSKNKQKYVEFHEEQPPFKRKPLSFEMFEQTKNLLLNQKLDLNSKKKQNKIQKQISSLMENDSDDVSSSSSGDKFEDNQPSIDNQFKTENSWYSILWTCQKKIKVKNFGKSSLNEDNNINEQENFKQNSNIQFLIFYKFSEEIKQQSSHIEIIGMLSNKMEREGFWVTPCQMNCENELEGILFDEIYDNNIIRLQDMQEKAIKFIKDQNCDSHDFQFFVKSLQPEILSKNNNLFQNEMFGGDSWSGQLIQKLKEQENIFL